MLEPSGPPAGPGRGAGAEPATISLRLAAFESCLTSLASPPSRFYPLLSLSPHAMRVFLLLAALICSAAATHTNLTGMGAPVTVSGISAGAFFATQFQIAFSGTVNGAGLIAGA